MESTIVLVNPLGSRKKQLVPFAPGFSCLAWGEIRWVRACLAAASTQRAGAVRGVVRVFLMGFYGKINGKMMGIELVCWFRNNHQPLLVGGFKHFLFSMIYGNHHPNWLIFFKPTRLSMGQYWIIILFNGRLNESPTWVQCRWFCCTGWSMSITIVVPSGKLTVCHWKWP